MSSTTNYVEKQSVEIQQHPNCVGTIGTIELIDELTKQPTQIRCKKCQRLGMIIYQKPLIQK